MENMSMDQLMDSFELKHFRKGDIVKGKVIAVKNEEVIVNIGHFADGIIPRSEISMDKDFDINNIQIDDEIYVMVLSGDDGDGNVLLSKRKADGIKVWDDLEESFKEDKSFKITVKEVVKGGVIALLNGVRVFMPASQCANRRIENLEELVSKELEVKVIEFNRRERKVVVSRRVIEEKEAKVEKAKLWNAINVGEKTTGTVKKIMKFGAFVNIGGLEGLIHLNDLAWGRVRNVEDVLHVGDVVEVYIKDIDREKDRLALSLKDICNDPWNTIDSEFKAGDTVEGTVANFIKVGAFVEIKPGIEGFVHISEITDDNITKAEEVLKIGDKVKVKILSIDKAEHKLSLSIKDASEKSKEYLSYNDEEEGFSLGDVFANLKL
ncbi:MAG: 30S ribosomal protein S1 [Sarcina sp.]